VEGMELTDHEDILVVDEPEDFARALVELYESEELWKKLSENGTRTTRELYSPDAARKKLEFLFGDEHLKNVQQSALVAQPQIEVAAKG
jgi:glycosyltransferase involved in cell wall biosynthesis